MTALFRCLVLVFLFVPQARAQEVMPSYVYQTAEAVDRELGLILELQGIRPAHYEETSEARRPRHIMQKVRESYSKLQKLQETRKLPVILVPAFSASRIVHADVKLYVDRLLVDVRKLKKAYAIRKNIVTAGYRGGKNTTDLYNKMAQISSKFDVLLGVAVLPSDVYRLAVTVRQLLEEVYRHKTTGQSLNVSLDPVSGKSPKDVFRHGYLLHGKLKKLEQQQDFRIDGGVGGVRPKKGRISPTDVLDLMNIILADVNAITLSVGLQHVTELVPYEGGKIPSDVYNEISKAIRIVEALL